MRHPPQHIFQHTPDTLREWCAARAMPTFRADQVLDWVYRKGVADPAQMLNLAKRDRETLSAEMTFLSGETIAHRIASDGTQKLLIEWMDFAAGDGAPPAPRENRDEPACEPEAQAKGLPLLLAPQSPVAASGDPSRQTECVMIPSESAAQGPRERNEAPKASPIPERSRPHASGLKPQAFSHASGLKPQASPRRTACISSQVGCPVGCRFCASGLGGLDGNLSAGRIVEQVWRLNQLLAQTAASAPATALDRSLRTALHPSPDTALDPSPLGGEGRVRGLPQASGPRPQASPPRISHIVFMGMGEPLANFAAVKHAVETLAAPWGMGISARRITISTVGLPQAIHRLAEQLNLPVTLALSLHAPNDELRRELIPWSNYTTIAELTDACDAWFQKTGREITLEYILLGGVNDQPEHAEQLASVAQRLRSNVNLIRYNEVRGMPYSRPATEDVRRFQDILRSRGVNTHIRASRGRDIEAACGQLRHEAVRP